MYSGEGEEVKLSVPVNPAGNVEEWLRHVEKSMKATLRDNIDRSLQVYSEVRDVLSLPEKNCCCSNIFLFADPPPATSYRVGVVLAWAGGHCRLSGLLDHRGVRGFGAGRLVQYPLPTAADSGQLLLGV